MNFKLFLSIIFICFNQLLSRSPNGLRLDCWLPERNGIFYAKMIAEDGSHWLLKQPKAFMDAGDRMYMVLEKMGSCMAETVGALAPKIYFFSMGEVAPNFTDDVSEIVSMHEWISGVHPFTNDALQQRVVFPYQENYRFFDRKLCGLQEATLNYMAKNDDLPLIAAIDTFMCNSDRSDDNFIFDVSENRYWAIDFEFSLRRPLAKYAIRTIKRCLDEKIIISSKEVISLHRYVDALNKLITKFTPKTFSKLLRSIAQEAGLADEKGKFIDIDAWRRSLLYRRTFQVNYRYCELLLKVIADYIAFLESSSDIS